MAEERKSLEYLRVGLAPEGKCGSAVTTTMRKLRRGRTTLLYPLELEENHP